MAFDVSTSRKRQFVFRTLRGETCTHSAALAILSIDLAGTRPWCGSYMPGLTW
jgi:hypothetical protein